MYRYKLDGKVSEILKIKVTEPKAGTLKEKEKKFFRNSNVYIGEIGKLQFDRLIVQLSKLKYDDNDLLYTISLRTILEGTYKKYLSYVGINLNSKSEENIDNFFDSLKQKIILGKKDPKEAEKLKLHSNFNGYLALVNFLDAEKSKFNTSYMSTLNSYTHTSRSMTQNDMEHIANDVILPIVILANYIIDNKF